jgi:hypothetical protein
MMAGRRPNPRPSGRATARYVNGGWRIWPQTFPGVTERITMTSPSAGWAFGSDTNGATVPLRYDGASWVLAPPPVGWVAQRINLLPWAYSMPGGDTWFLATQVPTGDTLLVAYAGGQWRKVAWPYPDTQPLRLFPDASSDIWGIGDIDHQEGCPPLFTTSIQQGVFLHYQQGRWSSEVLP